MLNIVQLGLGPIGQQITKYLSERPGLEIVGAVDPDPQIAGHDLGEHAGLEAMGTAISPKLKSVNDIEQADLAVIATLSSLEKVEPQIREAADCGLDIVSTCEELVHPRQTQPERASRIDAYCRERGVSCLGTGVNPGFLMDYLPSVLSSVCQNVDRIHVERVQDARPRRKPFQEKIGVGLTEKEFQDRRNSIRHVGLQESVQMIAEAMSWQLDRVCETLFPVMAERDLQNGTHLKEGQVAGVQQVARGYRDENEVITLVFKAAVGLEDSHDTVRIAGTPDFTSTIEGGINGDVATAAMITNVVRPVSKAEPGLQTMLDIKPPTWCSKL